jgi:hypothetical protein
MPRWWQVAVVNGVVEAAALAYGCGQWGTIVRQQVAVELGAGPKPIIGGGRRRQVSIAQHCKLCCLTPHLLCSLCQWRQRQRKTAQQWASWPLAGDVNVDDGGDGEGGGQPVTTATISSPPTAPPSTVSISLLASPLWTLQPLLQ